MRATEIERTTILAEVHAELCQAEKFGDFESYHEGIAVIREEYLELEREVFWGEKGHTDPIYRQNMRAEAIQLAAMAVKLIELIDEQGRYS